MEVATCESGLRPDAVSPSGTYLGLFQMHRRYHAHRPGMDQPLTPWGNTMAALDLFLEQGWRPWSCRP